MVLRRLRRFINARQGASSTLAPRLIMRGAKVELLKKLCSRSGDRNFWRF